MKIKEISKFKSLESNTVIVIGLLFFHYIFYIKTSSENNVLLYLSFFILFCSVFFSFIGKIITLFWIKLSHFLGWINSRIILGAVFYLFLTPLAFLYRKINTKGIKIKNNSSTVYTSRSKTYSKVDLIKPW